jgi:hypothetical protein
MLCYALLCYAMSGALPSMLCYAMLCYAMLCQVLFPLRGRRRSGAAVTATGARTLATQRSTMHHYDTACRCRLQVQLSAQCTSHVLCSAADTAARHLTRTTPHRRIALRRIGASRSRVTSGGDRPSRVSRQPRRRIVTRTKRPGSKPRWQSPTPLPRHVTSPEPCLVSHRCVM